VADQHYSSVSLQLEGEGFDGSTTITDTSSYNSSVTHVAGGFVCSTTQKYAGGSSLKATAGTAYITFPDTSDRFDLGSGDFTIECWYRPADASTSVRAICGRLNTSAYSQIYIRQETTAVKVYVGNSAGTSSSQLLTSGSVLVANTWIHIAVVRTGGYIYIYTGGVQRASAVLNWTLPAQATAFAIGTDGAVSWWIGTTSYVDDLRYTKGVARYTSTFTPLGIQNSVVSGNVKDDAGNNCARTVRAYARSTGYLIGSTTSNGTTGDYSIGVPNAEVDIVVLDDTSGTVLNDLIQRVTPNTAGFSIQGTTGTTLVGAEV